MTKLEALKSLGKVEDYILSQKDSNYSAIQKEEAMRLIGELYAKIQLVIV